MSDARLETPRLRLRPFAPRDVDTLHAQWLDPDVRRYLWDGRTIARDEVVGVVEESIASFAARRFGLWTIEAGSTPIGFAGLRRIPDSDDVELYYGLAPSSWRSGFATEAARAVLRYAFDVVGLARVWLRTDGPNVASVAVMERLGARYVRTERTGAFGETIVYVAERA